MKILCVEDGSVDIEKLENGEVREGKVLVYKQGSKPPFVLDIAENYNYEYSELNIKCDELQKENYELRRKLKTYEKYDKYIPKFKVGDFVYFVEGFKAVGDIIKEISCSFNENEEINYGGIIYSFERSKCSASEKEIFKTIKSAEKFIKDKMEKKDDNY